MTRKSSSLDRLTINTPCSSGWDAMTGNRRVRHCQECNKNVYNLSAIRRDEAEALIARFEGRLCARIERDETGAILTEAMSTAPQLISRRVSPVAAALVTALVGGKEGVCHEKERSFVQPPECNLRHCFTGRLACGRQRHERLCGRLSAYRRSARRGEDRSEGRLAHRAYVWLSSTGGRQCHGDRRRPGWRSSPVVAGGDESRCQRGLLNSSAMACGRQMGAGADGQLQRHDEHALRRAWRARQGLRRYAHRGGRTQRPARPRPPPQADGGRCRSGAEIQHRQHRHDRGAIACRLVGAVRTAVAAGVASIKKRELLIAEVVIPYAHPALAKALT